MRPYGSAHFGPTLEIGPLVGFLNSAPETLQRQMWASRREGHAPGRGQKPGLGAFASAVAGGSRICSLGITVTDKLSLAVTFNPDCGYVGTSPELRAPVVALSLGGLRAKVEALISPDDVIVTLNLDRAARLERDRRRLTGRPRPGFAGTSARRFFNR